MGAGANWRSLARASILSLTRERIVGEGIYSPASSPIAEFPFANHGKVILGKTCNVKIAEGHRAATAEFAPDKR